MTTRLETGRIIIGYRDGTATEGIVLARDGDTMRVAVKDANDVVLFTRMRDVWVSEDCEPVQVRFDWQWHGTRQPVSEADCICSKELAARLIHDLVSGDQPEIERGGNYEEPRYAPALQRVV